MQLTFEQVLESKPSTEYVIDNIHEINQSLINEFEYPDGSLEVVEMKTKGEGTKTYSVNIVSEVDLYTGVYSRELTIKFIDKKRKGLIFHRSYLVSCEVKGYNELKELETPKFFVRVYFDNIDSFYVAYKSIVHYALKNFVPQKRFECCDKYLLCSDTLKCQHFYNLLYARGCAYRKNLENGRIFYGKNQNVQ